MEIIQSVDITIFKWIHFYLKNGVFDILLPIFRNKQTWIPLYFYFIFHLYKLDKRNCLKIILASIVLVSLSDIFCAKVLKEYFDRLRPCQLFINEAWFSDFKLCSSTFSFPSCHALNHTVLAVFLFPYFKNMGKYLLAIWVLLIGYSQVYVGVHFPTDIIGGLCIGAFFALIARMLVGKFLKD